MMNLFKFSVVLILSITAVSQTVRAQGGTSRPGVLPPPVYRPPVAVGAPTGRVGGGSRGNESQVLLQPLVPHHTGLTLQGAPVLYWYLAAPASQGLRLTVIATDELEPLVEVTLRDLKAPAIHALDLEALGVNLESGVTYQWFVVMAARTSQRSREVIAGGRIRRMDGSETPLHDRLQAESGLQRASIYADAGIWYDAVQTIIETRGQAGAAAALSALLAQVGLGAASGHVLRAGSAAGIDVRVWSGDP